MLLEPAVQFSIDSSSVFTLNFHKAQGPDLNEQMWNSSDLVQILDSDAACYTSHDFT